MFRLEDEYRNLFLTAADGTRIAAEHWFSGNEDAVIIAPGFFQSKSTGTFRGIIRAINRHFDVIAMDFRGHGNSGGRYHFSAKEAKDLDCVARYASKYHKRLWVLGFSYGGSIALLLESRTPLFAGIICAGSPMRPEEIELEWWHRSSRESGRRSVERGTGCRIGSVWSHKEAAVDAIRQIKSTPILLIHGSDDRIVFPRHSIGLYDAAQGPKTISIIPSGGHAEDLFRTHSADMTRITIEWINKQLQNHRPSLNAAVVSARLSNG